MNAEQQRIQENVELKSALESLGFVFKRSPMGNGARRLFT